MTVPPKKRPRSAVRRRRSHMALKKSTLNACPKCSGAIRPHCACPNCGCYKGREAVKIKINTKKASK